ncbi:metallophosphoesterase [Dehalococcoides mccartyi]|nr:metallophosphoesterase [Dehalococcoides mccartyi]
MNIHVHKVMRFAQVFALLVVFAEAWVMLDISWRETGNPVGNPGGFAIVVALVLLLLLGEFVRVGKWTSTNSLMWLGHFARFTGLGWAATGFIVLVISWLIPGSNEGNAPFLLFWVASGLALAMSLYAFSIGRTRITVRKFKITRNHNDVTGEQPDRRIVVLSDLHLGDYVTTAHVRRAIDISNGESPDIVLLLGDFVEEDGSLSSRLIAELTLLEARLGVFAVLGNHDIDCRNSQQLIDELERDQTVSLLRNSSVIVVFEPDGEVGPGSKSKTVQIVGIESPGGKWSIESSLFGNDVLRSELSGGRADLVIVASHHPEVLESSAEFSADLVAAGHTHGGSWPCLSQVKCSTSVAW